MPPWLIRVRVMATASLKRWSLVRFQARQNNWNNGTCGNFGAWPMPPCCRSTSSSRRSAIWSVISMEIAPPACGEDSFTIASTQALDVLLHLVRIVGVGLRQRRQHVGEARPAPAAGRREIGAAPERPALGGEEHGERPAALLPQQCQGLLIDRVEVRPLLAVDLDVDVELVHERRDLRDARSSHAPSRGTNGTPHSRPTAGSAGCCAWPRPTPLRPRPTNPPDCPCAAADKGWFLLTADCWGWV